MLSKKTSFIKAVPVWPEEYEDVMNISILFKATVKKSDCKNGAPVLRIAGSSAFRISVNGEFYAMGPARAGHGYYRVDEYKIDALLTKEENDIEILVAGYNNNSFYWIDVPPFLAAEVVCGDEVVLCTGINGGEKEFTGYRMNERVQKVMRYSFQRNFTEVYDYNNKTDFSAPVQLALADKEDKIFLERGIFYPEYEREDAKKVICRGVTSSSEKDNYFMDRAIVNIGPALKGFKIDELEIASTWEAQKLDFMPTSYDVIELPENDSVALPENGYAVYDMGRNMSGLIGITVTCESDVTLYALFDEILTDGDANKVDFLRLYTSSVVMWKLPAGTHKLLSFEPYVYKYIRFAFVGGSATISDVHMRRVGFYMPPRKAKTDNPKIKAVFDAAVETFRQNTYDVYMDCASRERGGWLGDSFFTSRTERVLTGKSEVERNFLENFLQPESFKCLPDGMLPMCYPADHYDGLFLPNWTMWFVFELAEYYERTGDRELIDAAKDKVYKLFKTYFCKFENEDGLLEKLEGWIFLEWSKASELVQDINYPTNMLYAKMKRTAGKLYNDPSLTEEGDKLAEVIRQKAFNGKFFCDNAVYNENGVAELSGECTEACQYYAFHTGVATPELYPELWNTLLTDFGPQRKETGKYPEIYFANVLFGNFLRLDLLVDYGYEEELLKNIEGYFYYMAEKTGSLWENDTTVASCSHGFASHVIYWLDKLGLVE